MLHLKRVLLLLGWRVNRAHADSQEAPNLTLVYWPPFDEAAGVMPVRAFLVAMHDIPPNVELTFDYGRHCSDATIEECSEHSNPQRLLACTRARSLSRGSFRCLSDERDWLNMPPAGLDAAESGEVPMGTTRAMAARGSTDATETEAIETGGAATARPIAQAAAVRLTLTHNGELKSDEEEDCAPRSGPCTTRTRTKAAKFPSRQSAIDELHMPKRVAPAATLLPAPPPAVLGSGGASASLALREIIWDPSDQRVMRIGGTDTVDAEFTCPICVRRPPPPLSNANHGCPTLERCSWMPGCRSFITDAMPCL